MKTSGGVANVVTSGFIANADFGWFSHFLLRTEPPEEVDFWQPSPHGFKAIPPGAPFFFRLGAPHKAIAGFGFFARYGRVPAWLAWESFGDKNGTDTFAEMAARTRCPTGCSCAPTSTGSTTPATSPSRPTTAPASATTSPTTSAGGREHERFAGRAITVPPALLDQPDPELLDWHAEEVFRG